MAGQANPQPDEETVDALIETVRDLLRAEDARATGLVTRGSGLAGFLALIVSVTLALGWRGVTLALPVPWKGIVIGLFLGTLGFLLVTMLMTVFGVLLPRSYRSIAVSEVQSYVSAEVVAQPRVMVQGRAMTGLIESLATERKRNDQKALWLRRTYVGLVAAVFLAAANGAILGLHAGGVLK